MCDESVNFSTLTPRVLKFRICKQVHTENVFGGPGWTRTNVGLTVAFTVRCHCH